MSTENFIITKRDGTQESFSLEKIKSAILKAFANVSEHISAEQLKKIVDHLMFCNGMSVEDIQNQVEVALMAERHFKAAKAFMLYRQRHMEDRETADKLRFLNISQGSLEECRYYILLAKDLDYITLDCYNELTKSIEDVSRLLNAYSKGISEKRFI